MLGSQALQRLPAMLGFLFTVSSFESSATMVDVTFSPGPTDVPHFILFNAISGRAGLCQLFGMSRSTAS